VSIEAWHLSAPRSGHVRNGGIYDIGARSRAPISWLRCKPNRSARGKLMSKASNVVLFHGAWADGSSCWKVIPLLLARGLRVTAVQLPLTSLKDDVATVTRALALQEAQCDVTR
jgi:uncharacterized membrane protein